MCFDSIFDPEKDAVKTSQSHDQVKDLCITFSNTEPKLLLSMGAPEFQKYLNPSRSIFGYES